MHDTARVEYPAHFHQAAEAVAARTLAGILCVVFLDNFEWAFGYSKRSASFL